MTAKKRDQPHHNLIQQCLPGSIQDAVLGIIRELGDSYDVKPGLTTHQPSTLATANMNKASTPFQYTKSPFAGLVVVTSMMGCHI